MIIYGTQYYRPPFPERECWKDDLLLIKRSNMNTVKLWAVWSWIERKEGEYYFEDLDELVDGCAEVGLQVVINTIPEGMPYWAVRRHADAKYQTHDGQVIEVGGAANMPSGGSPGVCADKTEARLLICGFIRTVVERYAARDHVIAFDVWNELHIEPIFDYPEELFCYCAYSRARFTAWLQEKYGSLETLNRTWLRAYAGWEDVLPPVRFGTYPDMMDWRRFWIENLGAWLECRIQAAREVANSKPVMTHVPFSGYIGGQGEGGLGQHLGDEFVLAEKVDQFGLTSFPKWLMGNDFVQHLVNLELIASSAGAKEFWQSELQAGAGKWEAFGRPVATAEEIRLWNWSAMAAGAKGILYWQWRPEPSGTEAPGFGLTTLAGGPSERTKAASECAAAFQRPTGFDRARRVPAVNGIFVSRNADLVWHAADQGEFLYAKALYGAYRACFDAGIPARFVHADQINIAIAEGLEVIYLPAALALSTQEQADLKKFVAGGGTLISEACPGLFDDRGVICNDPGFLKDVFGLWDQTVDGVLTTGIQPLNGPGGPAGPGKFSGRYYRQDFRRMGSGVQVRGWFDNGRPAIFDNELGPGRAVLVGSLPSLAVALDQEKAAAGWIAGWMRPTGYAHLLELVCGKNVLARLHQTAETIFVSAVNYGEADQQICLDFREAQRVLDPTAGVISGRGGYRLELSISAKNGMIVSLENA